MFGIRVKAGHSNIMAPRQKAVLAVAVPVEKVYIIGYTEQEQSLT